MSQNGATATEGRTLRIGDLAEASGLSLRTIRHYDEVGLLRPTSRSAGGFRLYTAADLDRLLLIRRMKPLGFTLEQMHELLDVIDHAATAPGPASGRDLDRFVALAEDRRDDLAAQLAMATEFVETLKQRRTTAPAKGD